jgi:glucokinase
MALSTTGPKSYLIIDAGGTSLKSAILTEDGSVLGKSPFSTPASSGGTRQEITNAYNKIVLHALAFAEKNKTALCGIGIATPGPFDYENGVPLMTHKFQEIYGVSLRQMIYRIPGVPGHLPIGFIHDANAVLAGEMWKGNAQGYPNTAVVTLGTGIGFAFSKNNVFQCNDMGGPLVSIFKQPYQEGILEDYVSKRGILKIYQLMSGIAETKGIEVASIAKWAGDGDKTSILTFSEVGKILASALENILNENNIQCLLFGGQISRSFHLMEDAVVQGLKGVKSLQHISAVKSIDNAALFGALLNLKLSL